MRTRSKNELIDAGKKVANLNAQISGWPERGGYLDLHNFRNRELEARATRVRDRAAAQDLRFAAHLRDLRAPCRHLHLRPLPLHASLTMFDRHYGHLARDGREHAIRLLDELSAE